MRGSQLGRTADRRPAAARRRGPAAVAVLTLLVLLAAGALPGLVDAGVAAAAPAAPSPAPSPQVTPGVGHERSEALVYALAVVFAAVERVAESDGRDLVILVFVLLVMRLFLTIQNWIDRQDPKLIAAPLTRDRYMEFRDPPPATGRRTPRRPPGDGVGDL